MSSGDSDSTVLVFHCQALALLGYQELLDQLKKAAPYDWPRIYGLIVAHRIASVRAIRARLDQLLKEPVMNRRRLRDEMERSLTEIEQRGP
jgi:hypothetical protein